jgi:hypothetical protein
VVKSLSNKHEALRSNPNTTKEREIKNLSRGQVQWLMPVIPATREAEIKRISVHSQPRQKFV